MLGGFASKFDRYFLVGHVFPCLGFIALNFGLEYVGLLPFQLLPTVHKLGTSWEIVVIPAAALLMGLLLEALNRPIIMLYEGYPFKSWHMLRARQVRAWHKLYDRRQHLNTEKDFAELTLLSYRAHYLFPSAESLVLPTRLGNAIRASEFYSDERYGMDPIVLWSRLLPLLPTPYLDLLKEVNTSFNFLLNTMVLMQVLAVELLVAVGYTLPLGSLLGALSSLVISYLLYRAVVSRAIDWGFVSNAAFDLYRSTLLKQLGFRQQTTIEDERDLWNRIWWFIVDNNPSDLDRFIEKAEDVKSQAEE